jgi:class 3 adenylate cyclase
MPLQRRLAFRIAFITTAMVVLTIVYFGATEYSREHQALEERFGLALERIVATAALGIDGDAHKRVRTLEDTEGADFRSIRDQLRRVQEVNYLREDLLYTFHVDDLISHELRAAVMLQATPYTGGLYHLPEENVPHLNRVVESGNAGHSGLYRDQHGHWVSAWAPIRDSNGEIAGVLEADYDITRFEAALERELLRILLFSLVAILAAIAFSVVFARRLEVALNQIRAGAAAIEEERYEHRIPVDRSDELGLVARQFNRMAEVLSERFHLLKFIPRHTLEAVSRRVAEGDAEEAERVVATILFSDIRGYTKMSEGLSDEDVVRMLNKYLRRQAEIVREHDGNIDKFIGDAVLAVFTGDDHERHAVRAACAIQRDVAEMNESGAFERPVHIGIGIACGEMVLAELGSDERKERTIIGSVVNLASRLCSHAGADEIVASGDVLGVLGDDLTVSSTEDVELKGFSGTTRCHLVDTCA